MEHYFTKEGFYDGWASAKSTEKADEIIEELESRREFDDPDDLPATH